MTQDTMEQENSRRALELEAQEKLRRTFEEFSNKIPLLLFTSPFKNEHLSEAFREVIRFVRELTPLIDLKEYDLSHEEAKKRDIVYAPTLLFNDEQYQIRWLGAPVGEEGRTFIELLSMLGSGETGISDESKKVLEKIHSPRNVKVFVSPSCPYCPQQAVNCIKAAIEKPDLISLEIIDIQANPEIAEKYSAQSVPMTYADDILIAKGAQTEELYMSSLEKMEQQTVFIPESDAKEVETDLVIVGGGPAGLTAGIYGTRSGLKTVVVEKGALGGQVATTPIIENYPGLTQVGGKALVDLMVSHALEYVKIFPNEEVMEISPGDPMVVTTSRRRFTAKAVLLATGAKYRALGVPGESRLSGHGISYCSTCDGPLFKDRRVVVIGGGDSAATEVLHLHNIGVDVTLIHRKDQLRTQEHLITSLTNSQIPIIYNTEIQEIKGGDRVEEVSLKNNVTGEETTMAIDGVFIAIGYEPAIELAKKTNLEITSDGFIRQDSRHRTNIPGIYSAGDVTGGFKQIVTASGQGSAAALAIFEDLMNPYWKKED